VDVLRGRRKGAPVEKPGAKIRSAAMRQHDIGLHTDFHSVHPTIAEAMADSQLGEGSAEAERRERTGCEAIERVFGMSPPCWGDRNTWGPQVCEALQRLGSSLFVYAHTQIRRRRSPLCRLHRLSQRSRV